MEAGDSNCARNSTDEIKRIIKHVLKVIVLTTTPRVRSAASLHSNPFPGFRLNMTQLVSTLSALMHFNLRSPKAVSWLNDGRIELKKKKNPATWYPDSNSLCSLNHYVIQFVENNSIWNFRCLVCLIFPLCAGINTWTCELEDLRVVSDFRLTLGGVVEWGCSKCPEFPWDKQREKLLGLLLFITLQ